MEALTLLLDNSCFFRSGTKLYRQVVGIPMGPNCASLVAELFLFCYESNLLMCFSDDKQADVTVIIITLMLLTLHPDTWTMF